jgi:outer membrane protein assembly factor BamD
VSDHPGSVFREDAFYLKVQATTNLALNSTVNRKKERLQDAKEAYNTLLKFYPETKYANDARDLAEKVDKELEAFTAQENLSK